MWKNLFQNIDNGYYYFMWHSGNPSTWIVRGALLCQHFFFFSQICFVSLNREKMDGRDDKGIKVSKCPL